MAPITNSLDDESENQIRCVFGPQKSLFLSLPQQWKYSQGLAASKAAIVINYNIALFYSVAFAPNGAHFFAFKNKSGGTQWVFSQVNDKAPWFKGRKEWKASQTMQARLSNWLITNLVTEADVQNAVVVFGNGGSYFARTHKAMDWYGLPKGLDQILESGKNEKGRKRKPRTVAMGLKGTWAVVWEDGTCGYYLGGFYPDLEERFKARGNKDVNWIALSMYTPKQYFLCYTDGSLFLITINIWDSMLQTYLRQRSEKSNVALNYELTTKDAKTTTVVLPPAKKESVAGSGEDTSTIKDVAKAEESDIMEKVEDQAQGKETEKIEVPTEEWPGKDTHAGEQSPPEYEDLAS